MAEITRDYKISVIKELLLNHKRDLAIPEEYTVARYEFLVAEGLINFTKEEKNTIFDKAKLEYQCELTNLIHTGSPQDGRAANEAMINLGKNIFNKTQFEYLMAKCKIIGLKYYLDNVQSIDFK